MPNRPVDGSELAEAALLVVEELAETQTPFSKVRVWKR